VMVSDIDVKSFLVDTRLRYPNLDEQFSEFESLYVRKLWHQLTLKIEGCLADPAFNNPSVLIPFYKNFIVAFETKINLLALARIAKEVAAKYEEPEAAGMYHSL
jgi:26S proteasome regulatory subunit N9